MCRRDGVVHGSQIISIYKMKFSFGAKAPALPKDWIKKESRSKPGTFYYANLKTGKTQFDPPVDETAA